MFIPYQYKIKKYHENFLHLNTNFLKIKMKNINSVIMKLMNEAIIKTNIYDVFEK